MAERWPLVYFCPGPNLLTENTMRICSRRFSLQSIGSIFLMGLVATLGGCGGSDDDPNASPVVVDGSSTVFRISKAAQEAFAAVNSEINVIVGYSGTGGGFTKYLNNEIDIVDASRAAKPEEQAKAESQGLNWSRYLVGYDGISVVLHKKNDFVKELTVEQLKKLWEPDSSIKTWKDLDPAWPDREIKFYSPDDKSGTFEFFTEAVVGKAKSQRDNVQASSDDNILVRGVSGDLDGIGYLGYAYYKANEDKLRVVPIKASADSPPVVPSPESILDKTYTPLARPLFLYVKKSAYRRPAVASFVDYYLKEIDVLATRAKYVPPTSEDRAANQTTLDAAKAVTPSA